MLLVILHAAFTVIGGLIAQELQVIVAALFLGFLTGAALQVLAIVPSWDYTFAVRVIALSTLRAFWTGKAAYADAREPTLAWYRHVLKADWRSPAEVKREFGNASILRDGRVVFNIAGNKYRIVVWINYPYRIVYVRFIGTHAQYDKIDAQNI